MKPRVFIYSAANLLGLCAFVLSSSAQDVRISEFLASNVRGLQDEDRATSDWIEIHNAGATNVNLLNWGLTDDQGDPFRWRFPATNINAGGYMVVFASNKDRKVPGLPLHTDFGLRASGGYLALTRPDGSIATEFDPYPEQGPDVSYGVGNYATNVTVINSNASVRVRVPADDNEGSTWTTVTYDDSGWQAGTNGVGFNAQYVTTDIGGAMSNINASVRVRVPFTLSSTNIAALTLRMRYNDGFAAFLNGSNLITANAPEPLLFNSAATAAHASSAFEDFQLGAQALKGGSNVLAIQGLNLAANDPDFLVAAELVLSYVSEAPLFFTRPTPAAPNGNGAPYLGPAITDERHYPNVPKDNDDLLVTVHVRQTLFPVTNVVMRYRIHLNTGETNVTMLDDGLHGDGGPGDGIYGGSIPAGASAPSQMIRWMFRATDNRGNTSRWPLFSNPTNAAEYFGTIVDYNVTSKLPVIHLFAPASVLSPGPVTPDGVGADGPGGRVAVFYDGEFYDNVGMSVRGNTTAGYDKKSHRIEFNSEHLFRHSDEYPRIGNTSFVAEWPDPAYMRQGLCFWLGNLIGSPGSFYNPVRLQLNGVFYQLANHNDVQDEDLLDRLGFDPNGAMYNAAGRVNLQGGAPGAGGQPQSTGVFEKKTRGWDVISGTQLGTNPRGYGQDFVRLTTGIAETNTSRRINVYDLFDIPNAINYLVVARWAHENDDVWANMSLYHDNDGDDLWRIIGFDMNLSWGAIFFEGTQGPMIGVGLPGNVIGTYDAHKGHPLYGSQVNTAVSGPDGGAAWNRVYDVFFQNADLRQMYLRRTRSMMDQYVRPPGLHPLTYPMEARVRYLRDLMLPEAEMDRNFWSWAPRGGQCSFDVGHRLFQASEDLIEHFINKRRIHYYVTHSITNTSRPIGIRTNENAGIPLAQPTDAAIMVSEVEYNPASGNQLHEYLTVTNPNPYAVDISEWHLSGGVEFTFQKGTVIPSNSVLYVSPNVRAFKERPVAPRGGMGLFVVGPYRGQLSARGEPLVISNAASGIVYSNLYAGNPSLPQQYLRVTEIMYSPTPDPDQPLIDAEEYEFIELKNISPSATLSLTGVRFTGGITFNFTGSAVTSLAPGERVLVVKNMAAFEGRYGTGLPVAGQYVGLLDNGGDRIQLVDATNEEIHDFDYEDDWYPITDGGGFSLAIVDETLDTGEWDNKTNWRPSGEEYGAPGQPETAPVDGLPPILVNEVLTRTELPSVDTIELFNPTGTNVNIGGWFLTDDFSEARKFRIPDGTIIPAGGHLLFDEEDFNVDGLGFAFGSDGDEAYLFSADSSSNLTGYAHGYTFGAAANGVAFGRHTNSVGEVHFVAQSGNTLPGRNAAPRVGPIIISEIMYRPTDLPGGRDNENDEYIELRNVSGAPVQLWDPMFPQNTWQLRGGIEFDFPFNVTIPADGFVLIANFDTSDGFRLNAFRQKFNVPAEIPVFGPYQGRLANDRDEIELKRLDHIETLEGVVAVSVMVEQVDYTDEAPWPSAADGTGAALQRLGTGSYANDPGSWIAAAPNAGRAAPAGTAPTITSQPQNQAELATATVNFNVIASGSATLRYQWRHNGQNIQDGTNSVLSLNDVRPEHAGQYGVTVYNDAGVAVSSNATLTVEFGAYIFTQPASTNRRPNESVTFSISAFTESTLTYQWRFNGAPIPGANTSSYTISSVQVSDDGNYDVVLTDDAGTLVSATAVLRVLVNPVVLVPPLSQTVPRGGSATLSVLVTNTATLPMEYRWRVNNRNIRTNIVNRRYDFFTISNVMAVSNVAVGLVNVASSLLSPTAVVTPVDDFDNDGMADAWEVVYGFDTNSAADATQDLDLDTFMNRDEYVAGTDPLNAQSNLKVSEAVAGGDATVSFQAVSNRTYSILSVDSLGTPWSTLAPVVARTNNRIESVIDPVTGRDRRLYRVVTPYQP